MLRWKQLRIWLLCLVKARPLSADSQVSEATASTSQQLSEAAEKPGQDSPMSPEVPPRNEKEEQGISIGNTSK